MGFRGFNFLGSDMVFGWGLVFGFGLCFLVIFLGFEYWVVYCCFFYLGFEFLKGYGNDGRI